MIKLGVTLPQFTSDRERLVDSAQAAEELGLDSMWVFDHLWPLGGPKTRPIYESWTTLAYLAVKTHRIQIGTLVSRSTLREPALLAKMAATLEAIAPGRLVIAIGSGDELSRAENEAFGIPYVGGEDRVPQLMAALECVRECLDRPVADVETPYHRIERLPTSPRPVAPPPIWAGGRSSEILAAAGAACSGWNAWAASPEEFEREGRVVRAAAGDRAVELSWGGQVIVAEDDAGARAVLGDRPAGEFIMGAPETVAGRLRALVEAGAEHLIAAFPTAGPASYGSLAGPVRKLLIDQNTLG